MSRLRRLLPAVSAVAVVLWWVRTDTVATLVVFGLTAAVFAVERHAGSGPRTGEGTDLVHLTVTTALVRFSSIELVVASLRDVRTGPTIESLPLLPRVLLAVLVFDLAGYLHHRLMHESATLWPVHRVHHAVERVDVLIKARRHPLDDVLLIVFFGAVGFLIGVDPVSLRIVGIVATVHGMIVHANLWVRPSPIDRVLITPWIHHRHHGVEGDRFDYAGLFAIWDQILGTRGRGAPTPPGADIEPLGDWVDQMVHPFAPLGWRGAALADDVSPDDARLPEERRRLRQARGHAPG